MDLSVIVAARNEQRHLAEQLDALLAQQVDVEWEIVVADNGSSDGTAAIVQQYAERSTRVRLFRADERPGKAYAMNAAAHSSTATALVFTDADDVVGQGWLAAMVKGLGEFPVLTGPNELDRLNPPWLAESRGRGIEAACGTYFGLFSTIRGNNFGVRRATWDQLGGISEGIFPCEDLEFSLRCWLGDVGITGSPGAVVHYRYRESSRALWRQGWQYGSHRPLITKMLKEADKPTPPKFGGWKSWLMLVVKLPTVVTRNGRASWLWIAGNRLGQVAGSIRYRTLML